MEQNDDGQEMMQGLIDRLTAHMQETEWEELTDTNVNADKADPDAPSLRSWRKDGDTTTSFTVKMESIWPMMNHNEMYAMFSDIEAR